MYTGWTTNQSEKLHTTQSLDYQCVRRGYRLSPVRSHPELALVHGSEPRTDSPFPREYHVTR